MLAGLAFSPLLHTPNLIFDNMILDLGYHLFLLLAQVVDLVALCRNNRSVG